MGHYLVGIIIPNEGEPRERVAHLLAPFEETVESAGKWDWYTVGGRFTGLLANYDPHNDPRNIEHCDLCHGSGVRRDEVGIANGMVERKWCNGCSGIGKCVKWPTEWVPFDGDVSTVATATERGALFSALVTPDGEWIERPWDKQDEDAWLAAQHAIFDKYPDHRLVVVDCHR